MLPITNLLYLQFFRQTSMTSDSKPLEVSVILFSKLPGVVLLFGISILITPSFHC